MTSFPWLLALFFAFPAHAERDVPTPVPELLQASDESTPSPSSPEDALESAISDYLVGNLEDARLALIRLVGDPRIENTDLRQTIRIYLGEVQYTMGETQACWNTFLAILIEDPTYQIDQFVHPPEVVSYFDSVREYAVRFQTGAQPTPSTASLQSKPPLNITTIFVPGGLQFYNEQRVFGVAALTGVSGFVATSVGLRFYLLAQDQQPNTPGINVDSTPEAERLEQIRTWQNFTVWAATGAWSMSVLQGMLRTNRDLSEQSVRLYAHPLGGGMAARW